MLLFADFFFSEQRAEIAVDDWVIFVCADVVQEDWRKSAAKLSPSAAADSSWFAASPHVSTPFCLCRKTRKAHTLDTPGKRARISATPPLVVSLPVWKSFRRLPIVKLAVMLKCRLLMEKALRTRAIPGMARFENRQRQCGSRQVVQPGCQDEQPIHGWLTSQRHASRLPLGCASPN